MNRHEFYFSMTGAMVIGLGYLFSIEHIFGSYAVKAPPVVNALGGIGLFLCVVTVYGFATGSNHE